MRTVQHKVAAAAAQGAAAEACPARQAWGSALAASHLPAEVMLPRSQLPWGLLLLSLSVILLGSSAASRSRSVASRQQQSH